MNNAYTLTVRTGKPIPRDVLVEHLAVALRDLKFLGGYYITCDKVQEEPMARQHPFDGPEMFDDYFAPKPPTTGTANEGGFTAIDPYSNVTEAAFQLREAKRDEP